jgi:hypothetical protein
LRTEICLQEACVPRCTLTDTCDAPDPDVQSDDAGPEVDETCEAFSVGLGSYLVCSDRLDFQAAREKCEERSARLVVLNDNGSAQDDIDEERALLDFADRRRLNTVWLGLRATGISASPFAWIDGSNQAVGSGTDARFVGGEPNSSDEDCVEVADQLWNDSPCGLRRNFVCEEAFRPTTAVPSGCTRVTDIGTYLLCTTPSTWDEASAFCLSHDAILVDVDDGATPEARDLEREALDNATEGFGVYWIGVSDRVVEGQFVTTRGNALSSTSRAQRFAPLEPSNFGAQDCVAARTSGGWFDDGCLSPHAVICERTP